MTEGTTYQIRVDTGTAGTRLDALLPRFVPDFSRTRGQQLITAGLVTVNGVVSSKRYAVHAGDRIEVVVPPPAPAKPLAEEIPLEILHEDTSLVAVNKPAGMVVHPAPGHAGGTLVNALLAAVPTLSGIGGEVRPGIVHRLDKGTSGVVLVAKNDRAHRALAAQFAARQVAKTYLALAWGVLQEDEGRWDTAIGRDAKDRQKISPRTRRPRPAVTLWRVLRRFPDATLLELHPETGRTHQLRVHLAGAHHPILGDPVYGPRGGRESAYRRASVARGFRDRLALHAWKIAFAHPTRRSKMEIVAPPPPQFQRLLDGTNGEVQRQGPGTATGTSGIPSQKGSRGRRAVASFALDRGLSGSALETHNSPCGLRKCVSPLRGRSGPDAAGPSRSATHPPVVPSSPPRVGIGGRRSGAADAVVTFARNDSAEGWREAGDPRRRAAPSEHRRGCAATGPRSQHGNVVRTGSDRTPQPTRKRRARP